MERSRMRKEPSPSAALEVPGLELVNPLSQRTLLSVRRWRLRLVRPVRVPCPDILHHLVCEPLHRWQDLDDGKDQRAHQELDEAHLRERPVDLLSVVQRLHWHAEALLLVALEEELLEHLPGPEATDAEGLHGVGNVCDVQQHLRQQLPRLRLAEALHRLARREVVRVVCIELAGGFEDLGVHLVHHLHLLDHGEVLRVVGVQDRVYADLAHVLILRLCQCREDVALHLRHDLKELGTMHVLQRRFVVVPQREVVGGLYEEGVVEAWMAHVMAHGAHQQCVPLVAAQEGIGGAGVQEAVDPVRDVDGVEPVVVRA
mmetsp:Transcript_74711/g.198505  ORF Transcript_74711/g.198505 Transcript_74711/m.198505 type:complete len:315 (-) Transcript_74711:184-1128(-)